MTGSISKNTMMNMQMCCCMMRCHDMVYPAVPSIHR